MMSYQKYSVEDFLADESFQQYCSGTDDAAIEYWDKVLRQQQEVKERFKEAVEWYRFLNAGQGNLKEQTTRLSGRIEEENKENSKSSLSAKHLYRTWWAAAAVLFLLAAGSFFLLKKNSENEIAVINEFPHSQNDIAPGGNKAILTLADGRKLVLDTTGNGVVTKQGNVTVIKLDGRLAYNKEGNTSNEVLYNTITTPNGGQYQLILADGTKVWLNAASSLRFPTTFAGEERSVELTGEGYFEVAHNAAMPFYVKVADMYIQVLGTHFNSNTYEDEPVAAVTLLEGSVKINKGYQSVILKEGQQARVVNDKFRSSVTESNTSAFSVANDADLKSVLAWKNGLFDFNNAHITDIMRQLARWYDVEIVFKGKVPERHYTGAIRKSVNLSEVIKMLELAGGVQVTISNKKLIVQE